MIDKKVFNEIFIYLTEHILCAQLWSNIVLYYSLTLVTDYFSLKAK